MNFESLVRISKEMSQKYDSLLIDFILYALRFAGKKALL